ncbi:hypothetical protein LTR49_028468, partial [Elasticomyces elasticus]
QEADHHRFHEEKQSLTDPLLYGPPGNAVIDGEEAELGDAAPEGQTVVFATRISPSWSLVAVKRVP